MIFKSICLAAAFSAAPTEAVVSSSSNSTKLSNDTYEPKGRVGAPRRDLGSGTKSAFVLLKRGDPVGLGHVAGCFEEDDGNFMCFSRHVESFWYENKPDQDAILKHFKDWGYTDWKRLDVYDADPKQALAKMNELKDMEYNLIYRNCQNAVYDILHDEGSGFGITANSWWRNNGCYIGWVQEVLNIGPTHWFVSNIAATASGIWQPFTLGDTCYGGDKYCARGMCIPRSGPVCTEKLSDANEGCSSDEHCASGLPCLDGKCRALPSKENEWCSNNNHCASGLTCCGGKCKKKVNKRWCMSDWFSWTCFDNWTCP